MRCLIVLTLFCSTSMGAEPRLDPYGDPVPEGATARIGSTRTHIDTLSWAAITPDGRRIVSGGMYGEKCITVWEAASMKRLQTLPTKETNETWCVAVSPDGKRAGAVLSSPGKQEYAMSAVVWDIESGKLLCDVPLGKRNNGAERLAFSTDGKRFAVVCEDLRIVEIDTGKVIAQTPFSTRLGSLKLIGDNRFVFAGHLPELHLWDAATLKAVEWSGDDRPDFAIDDQAMTPDGKYLFVAAKTKILRYKVQLPTKSGEAAKLSDVRSILIHDGDKAGCWPAPDGLRCIVRSSDGHVEIVDFDRLKAMHRMEVEERQVFDVAFPVSGPLLLVRGGKNRWERDLEVVDLPKRDNLARERGLHFVRDVPEWLPDSKRIRTGRQLWDAGSGKYLGEVAEAIVPKAIGWKAPNDWGFSISPDSRTAVVAVGDASNRVQVGGGFGRNPLPNLTLEVWDVAANRRLRPFRGRDDKLPPIYALGEAGSLSFDGRFFVYCDPWCKKRLEIWDATVGRSIAVLDPEPELGELRSLTLVGDGRRLFIAGTTGVGVYDLRSRTFENRIALEKTEKDQCFSAVSTDCRSGAIARADGDLIVFDLVRNEIVLQTRTQQNGVSLVAFSPDSRQVLTQGRGSWVHVWALPDLPDLPEAWKEEEFETAWKTLLAPKGSDAAEAMRRWNRCGPSAVEFIGKRLATAIGPDEKELTEKIDELGAVEFRRREAADRELSNRGERIVPSLQKRLEKERDAEIRQRLQKIIFNPKESVLPVPAPEQLRGLRAVEILERIASPAAKSHLQRLGTGAEGEPLTGEAQMALRRWR